LSSVPSFVTLRRDERRPGRPEIGFGAVTDAEGGRMHVRMARYTTDADPHELVQRAESGMLPLFESQPGFRAYSIAVSGDEVFSFSVWDTPEDAEAANTAAAGWVAENMADDITLVETNIGELMLSTALGISPARA
jgi:heme-degrading monooxygenase HmoA